MFLPGQRSTLGEDAAATASDDRLGEARLQAQRSVLDVQPRRGDRLLQRHVEREQVQQRLQHRRADAVGAARAESGHACRRRRGRSPASSSTPSACRSASRATRPGLRSASPSMLLRMMPVPGSTYPEPSPLDTRQAGGAAGRVDDADLGGAARDQGRAHDLVAVAGDQRRVEQRVARRVAGRTRRAPISRRARPVARDHLDQPGEVLAAAEAVRRACPSACHSSQAEGDEDAAHRRRRIELDTRALAARTSSGRRLSTR